MASLLFKQEFQACLFEVPSPWIEADEHADMIGLVDAHSREEALLTLVAADEKQGRERDHEDTGDHARDPRYDVGNPSVPFRQLHGMGGPYPALERISHPLSDVRKAMNRRVASLGLGPVTT